MTRAVLRALLLATSTFVSFAAIAQPAPKPATQSGTADAIRVLLDQARYWRGQLQDENANTAIGRVLVLDPNNADALAMQAQAAADSGDTAVANAALAKLRVVRPDDPRIQSVEQALKAGPLDATLIAQARALAKDGKKDEAIAVYRQAFKGDTPPPGLAVEYYQTMVGGKEDWSIPRAGLAQILRANPENLKAQLVYAELLTYHNETRAEGMDRLNRLAQNPAIAGQATKDLRQALMWLEISPDSVPQFDIYLAKHPDDKEIAKLAETARSNTGEFKVAGYYYLGNHQLPEAEAQFSEALKRQPDDANAMIGLALVLWDEKRADEARALLDKAIATDPSKAADYQPMVDGWAALPGAQPAEAAKPAVTAKQGWGAYARGRYNRAQYGRGNYAGGTFDRAAQRRIQAQFAQISKLTNEGEFAKAEALLRKVAGRNMNTGTLVYLADIQARAGRLDEAEQGYRAVLERSPRNVQALGGLAGVLSREGKQAEADTLFAQAAQLPGGSVVGPSRARALRLQAEQMTDPVAQIGMYRTAVNFDPNDPWLRLDLARALLGQQDDAGARAVMAPVTAAARPNEGQLLAGIYFSNEINDNATVVRLIGRLPPKQLTAPMMSMRTTAEVRQQVREAKALGSESAERDQLLRLASEPDPTGVRVSYFGAELTKLGDKAGARDVVRAALAARTPTAEQRVAYGGTLLGAGYPSEAREVTQSVSVATGVLSQRLTEVRNGAAVAASDKLNAAGNPAAAYDELTPRLATAPDNPDLNLALARLYWSNDQPGKAVKITSGLLEQNPSNLSVRSSAVYANMADGELRQANKIALETTEQFPDEPQAWLDLANVERARGHTGNALRALQTAKQLRQKQLAGQQGTAEHDYGAAKAASIKPLPEPLTRYYAQTKTQHAARRSEERVTS